MITNTRSILKRKVPGARSHTRACRRGTIFIVVLWILLVLAGLVLTLGRSMRVEALASANQVATIQATTIEKAAEQYVLALLDEQKDSLSTLTDDYFSWVQVGDGYFWLIRPNWGDDQFPTLGLVDEAAKLNINTATADMLMALPGMTDDIANSIVDWVDADSDPSPDGAESDYYLSLPNPYNAKNAPFETLEELLLVRSMTPDLLYGQSFGGGNTGLLGGLMNNNNSSTLNGAGGNGGLNNGSGTSNGPLTLGSDQILAQGWQDFLTVYSAEPAQTSNQTNIVGPGGRGGLGGGGNAAAQGQTLTQGKININTAPREVLLTLPGLTDSDVTAMMSARLNNTTDPTSTAWLDQAISDKANGIRTLITGQSYQYMADIVAIAGNGRSFKRVKIVVDLNKTPPTIIYRRDITDRGFPLDPQILTQIRQGQGPANGNNPLGASSGF